MLTLQDEHLTPELDYLDKTARWLAGEANAGRMDHASVSLALSRTRVLDATGHVWRATLAADGVRFLKSTDGVAFHPASPAAWASARPAPVAGVATWDPARGRPQAPVEPKRLGWAPFAVLLVVLGALGAATFSFSQHKSARADRGAALATPASVIARSCTRGSVAVSCSEPHDAEQAIVTDTRMAVGESDLAYCKRVLPTQDIMMAPTAAMPLDAGRSVSCLINAAR